MSQRGGRTPSDEAARSRARTELNRSFLVEAGAGTGKTSILVDRVTEILKTEISLDRVAVITFTEKAAGELKVRLRQKIEEMIRKGGESTPWGGVLSRSLEALDRAALGTIHSFAASLLRERPVEGQVDPRFAVADELTAVMLLEETWDRWLEEEMSRRPPALERALRLGINLRQIRGLAFDLARRREVEPEPAPAMDANLAAVQKRIVSEISELAAAAERCADPADEGAAALREAVAALPDLESTDGDRLLIRLQVFPLKPTAGSQKAWNPPGELKRVKAALQALKQYRDETTCRARTGFAHELAIWLHEGFLHAYRAAKESRRLLDFEDLLILCRDMLRQSRPARAALQQRFACLLVDEFQDTDPLQAEILFLLAADHPEETDWRKVRPVEGKLFLVGDPKQSIYRFRRADIETYEQAGALLPPDPSGDPPRLTQNFRTVPTIVAWVNALFPALIGEGYEPINAFRLEPDGIGSRVLLLPPRDPGTLAEARAEQVRVEEARGVVALIRSATGGDWTVPGKADGRERSLRHGDIALLFRTSTAFEQYEDALREAGIPYRIAGGKRYYMRAEMRALQAVIAAIETPYDPLAVVSALRCPFFGYSDEELLNYAAARGDWVYVREGAGRGTPLERAFDLLRNLHASRNARSLAATLESLFRETGALALFYLKPDGDQRAANLLKAIDLARAHERLGGATFASFIRWLASMADEERDEGEAPLTEETDTLDEAGGDAVRISTVHKAKGLEFPMVILCDAAGASRAGGPPCVIERDRIEFRAGPADTPFESAGYTDAAGREKDRLASEQRRLLYVAATRARDWLVVPLFASKRSAGFYRMLDEAGFLPGSGAAPEDSVRGARLLDASRLEPASVESRPFRVMGVRGGAADPAAAAAREGWRRVLKEVLLAPPTGRAFRSASAMEGPTDRSGSAGDDPADPREARALGVAVHAVLERVDLATGRHIDLLAEEEADTVGRPDLAGEVRRLARGALQSPIVKEALASPRCFREIPFVAAGDGYLSEGRIDLVFESGGALTIVDFKTDRVTTPEEIEARVASYRPQALAYARALTDISRLRVARVVFHFVRPGVASALKVDEGFLAAGRRLLESGIPDPAG